MASDPTVSRTIAVLAADAAKVLTAINAARAAARARVWALAGEYAPDVGVDADNPIVIDTDATLLTAHSDKQGAAPTFKRGYGFHPVRREALLIRAEVKDHRRRLVAARR